MPSKSVLVLLKSGGVGLAFISIYLAYRILRSEQRRKPSSRKRWVMVAYGFMGASFVVFSAGTLFDYCWPRPSGKSVAALKDQNRKLTEQVKKLRMTQQIGWRCFRMVRDHRDALIQGIQKTRGLCTEQPVRALRDRVSRYRLQECLASLEDLYRYTLQQDPDEKDVQCAEDNL